MDADKLKQKIYRLVLLPLIVATPVFMANFWVAYLLGQPIENYFPFHNDEIHYWLQIRSFFEHGFDIGYNVVEEMTVKAFDLPFGPHGPLFPVIYGLIASCFSWQTHTPIVINFLLTSIAVLVFMLNVPRKTANYLLTFLFFVSFAPLATMMTTIMQDAFHFAFAIAISVYFYFLINGKRKYLALGGAICGLISLLKPSWLILMLPVFYLIFKKKKHGTILSLLVFCLYSGVTLWLYKLLAAPFPGEFAFVKSLENSSPLFNIWTNVKYNFQSLNFIFQKGHWAERLVWVQLVVILFVCAWKVVGARNKKESVLNLWSTLLVFNGTTFILIFSHYIVGNMGSYRLLSGLLLFSCCLLLQHEGRLGNILISLFIAMNTLFYPALTRYFVEKRAHNFLSAEKQEYLDKNFSQVEYNGEGNKWCNTLAIALPFPFLYQDFVHLPPGIGTSAIFDWHRQKLPLQSKYLIISNNSNYLNHWKLNINKENSPQVELKFAESEVFPLTKVANTRLGQVYENLNSSCQ